MGSRTTVPADGLFIPAPPRGRIMGRPAADGVTEDPTPLGDHLAAIAPGAELARLLNTFDQETASAADLVEAVAAAVRQASWTHARCAELAAELARRPTMNPAGTHTADPVPENGCVAGEELALRLGVTRQAARSLISEGIAYDGPLAATGRALSSGHIDTAKARLISARLADLPYEVTDHVECRILPGADRRTTPQLARDLERAVLVALGSHTDAVHAHARSTRRVCRPRILPDGMAALHCILPAADAARVDAVLDSCARTARTAGDPRTLAQLRADGLCDLIAGIRLPIGVTPQSATNLTGPGADHHNGLGSQTSTLHGTVRNPRGGGAAAPVCETLPGGGAETTPGSGSSAPLPARAPGDRAVLDLTRVRATIQVVVSLSTLLGLDDAPADLTGVGPISATDARDIALAAGSTWRRLVTDPLSGAVLDLGRTRYRPPTALADHIRTRDRSCARPGCAVPASRCDLDHTIEFHAPAPGAPPHQQHLRGGTDPANLGPLCRRDHRLKSTGGFVLRQVEPGVFDWTTPTGHRYRVRPGADTAYTRLPSVTPGTPIDLGAPPF